MIEHFVAHCGAGDEFCSQGRVIEAVLFIEGIESVSTLQRRRHGWRAVSGEVFAKTSGKGLKVVGVVRLELADDGVCDWHKSILMEN